MEVLALKLKAGDFAFLSQTCSSTQKFPAMEETHAVGPPQGGRPSLNHVLDQPLGGQPPDPLESQMSSNSGAADAFVCFFTGALFERPALLGTSGRMGRGEDGS